MPIYAYRCESCGHAKDVLQKISDPLLTVCPACNAETFRKQLTAAGFQLKGSGWYVTDFRGGNSATAKTDAKPDVTTTDAKPDAPASTPSSDAPSAASSSSSDSAPAAGCGGSCACH